MIIQDKLKNGLTRVRSDKGQISIDGSKPHSEWVGKEPEKHRFEEVKE